MPRDVQVRATRLLPDGDLVLAGTRDGPLTHTEPSMTHNDGFWGIARIGSIEAILEHPRLPSRPPLPPATSPPRLGFW